LKYRILHFDGQAVRDGADLPSGVMVEVLIRSRNVVRELADQLGESEEQMLSDSVLAVQAALADPIEQLTAAISRAASISGVVPRLSEAASRT
jgi:hypothetical protein